MRNKYNQVYQFKISLKGIKPTIWRRIQVPETYTFWDLHVAIQDAMGWEDYHLHEFRMMNPDVVENVKIGYPDGEYGMLILKGWEQWISDYFSMGNSLAEYIYDFGDNWKHIIRLERIITRSKKIDYPVCIAGERACPPEDCGSYRGYENFLKAISDPNHEQHKELLTWIGGEFDAEHFDIKKVFFDDPEDRLKDAINR